MIALSEGLIDLSQARLDEVQQVVVADVSGGHDKQPGWRASQQVALRKSASLVTTIRPSRSAKPAIC